MEQHVPIYNRYLHTQREFITSQLLNCENPTGSPSYVYNGQILRGVEYFFMAQGFHLDLLCAEPPVWYFSINEEVIVSADALSRKVKEQLLPIQREYLTKLLTTIGEDGNPCHTYVGQIFSENVTLIKDLGFRIVDMTEKDGAPIQLLMLNES